MIRLNHRTGRNGRRTVSVLLFAVSLSFLAGCTLNPATGQRQFSLIGEQQEIAMGRDYDKGIEAELGLYPNDELQQYIQELGTVLASTSERPDLPWEFHVIDDPSVNAFAVPGGFIYVTRGILAHFNSEAQLASVLGHEIGHVTARHSVEQMSRAQLAQIGLGVAMIASEDFRKYSDLAQLGLGVLFLKFGRDDEKQSDDLGLRYLTRAGYEPHEMPKVFEMLDRQTALGGHARLPEWQSTHPNPDHRAERITRKITKLPPDQQHGIVDDVSYLKRLDGMIFGMDPRQGYAVDSRFYHPDMAFILDFPKGWEVINQRAMVAGVSPEKDGVVTLTIAKEGTKREATEAFFSQEGIKLERRRKNGLVDFSTVPQTNAQGQTSQTVNGSVGFLSHGGLVFRLLCYAPSERWNRNGQTMRQSLTSFRKLTDPKHLNVKPKKIELVTLPRAMTLEQFAAKYPSSVDLDHLAVLNGVELGETMDKGRLVKRIVGKDPPGVLQEKKKQQGGPGHGG